MHGRTDIQHLMQACKRWQSLIGKHVMSCVCVCVCVCVQAAPDAKLADLKALLGRMLFGSTAMDKKVRTLRYVTLRYVRFVLQSMIMHGKTLQHLSCTCVSLRHAWTRIPTVCVYVRVCVCVCVCVCV